MARQSVVFEEAVAQFPLTTPSHASILTSRYVRSHGATDNAVPIHESAVLLSELLGEQGYYTAGFVTIPLVGSRYGFDRGFDYFVEVNRGDFARSSFADWVGQLRLSRLWWRFRELDRVTVEVERWLRRGPRVPFFLWIHQYKPHTPYAPAFSFERAWNVQRSGIVPTAKELDGINMGELTMSDADLEHIVSLYDAEIAFTDHLLARVFDALERQGLMSNTLIVFTADHGESLYDRSGYFGHGDKLYEEEIIVPLFFYAPGLLDRPSVVERTVESIDIAPTILDLLDLPPESSFQGVSLRPLLVRGSVRSEGADTWHGDSGESTETSYAYSGRDRPAFAIAKYSRMVRRSGLKYVENDDGTEELYDLLSDPGETQNLISTEPERAVELRKILRRWDESLPSVREGEYELDEESIRMLRTLGYVD
jgi:arylsulfatase A-like enzyme